MSNRDDNTVLPVLLCYVNEKMWKRPLINLLQFYVVPSKIKKKNKSGKQSSHCQICKCTNVGEEFNILLRYWWIETNFDLMTSLVSMETDQKGTVFLENLLVFCHWKI